MARWRTALLLFLFGLAMTGAIDAWRESRARVELENRMHRDAVSRLKIAADNIRKSAALSQSLASFMDVAGLQIGSEAFQDFAETLQNSPGVEGAFVAQRIDGKDREAFESRMQTRYPGFLVRVRNRAGILVPDIPRKAYTSILLGKFKGQGRLGLGEDVGAESEFNGALAALQPGKLLLSSPVRDQRGEVIFVAMWVSVKHPELVDGVILAPSQLQIEPPEASPVSDFWFDATDNMRDEAIVPSEIKNANLPTRVMAVKVLPVGGRTWRMEARTSEELLSESAAAGRWVLLGIGGILSGGAALVVLWATRRDPKLDVLLSENRGLLVKLAQREVALSDSEDDTRRLRTIIDSAGDALLLVDERGEIELFSHAAEAMFGYGGKEMQGEHLTRLFQSFRHRQDDTIIQFLSGGSGFTTRSAREMLGRRKDGTAFPIELSFSEFHLAHTRYFVVLIRDITDRKRAERMLFESEYKHRAILDAAFIGIYVQQDGKLRFVNPTFGAYFGLPASALTEKVSLVELVSDSGLDLLSSALDMDRNDPGRPIELIMQRPDGSRFFALFTAKPIIFDNRPGVAGSLLDITERKAAEDAMERAELRNLAILQAIPDLMLQLDAEGIITDCRSQGSSLDFGVANDCVGTHFRWSLQHEAAVRLETALRENHGQVGTFEYTLQQEHDQHYFEVRLTPMADGEMLLMVRDISERKRIEAELIRHRDHLADLVRERTAELNSLFAASPLPMALLSHQRFVEVNHAFEKLFGYTRDMMVGESSMKLLADASEYELSERELYPLLSSGDVVRAELRYRAQDGRIVLCDAFGKSVDREDPLYGSIWIYQDVGEQRAAESALKEAKELAEMANRAKSQFLANMSHELRTPLHAVLSFAELGQSKAPLLDVQKISHYFERIRQSGQRLLHILNDLLDLAKLEAGKMRYDMQLTVVLTVVRDVCDELNAIARPKHLQIRIAAQENLPVVLGDPFRLAQVVRNLVANAIKFSPEGGLIDVTISRNEQILSIMVDDSGVGIPAGELEAVFDKFIQSTKTHTGAGGTGLGLAISREIVAAHGGTIVAENRPEGGARLIVRLPVAPVESSLF